MELIGKLRKTQPGQLEFVALISLITSLTAASIDALLPALQVMGDSLAVVNMLDIQLVIPSIPVTDALKTQNWVQVFTADHNELSR